MIAVSIVAEIRLYRDGLVHVLNRERGIRVVGSASTAAELLPQLGQTLPDIVLIDMAIPDGLDSVRAVAAAAPITKIIALAVAEVEDEVVACVEAGAAGFVVRDASFDQLVVTIDAVARNEVPCSPRIAAALVRRVAELAGERREPLPKRRLTPRELQIVELIEAGLSNKEIALRLSIELATVKNHVHNILEKLQAHGRFEAVAQVRQGSLGRVP